MNKKQIMEYRLKKQLKKNSKKELEIALSLIQHGPTLYPLEEIIVEGARKYLETI